MVEINEDVIVACADLVERAGARALDMGYINDDPDDPGWWAQASYRGAKLICDGHKTPDAAALALATRLLSGAACRCLRPVALTDGVPGACRWQLVGRRWQSTCNAPPITVRGERGDLTAMRAAMGNRAERRARKRRSGRG